MKGNRQIVSLFGRWVRFVFVFMIVMKVVLIDLSLVSNYMSALLETSLIVMMLRGHYRILMEKNPSSFGYSLMKKPRST